MSSQLESGSTLLLSALAPCSGATLMLINRSMEVVRTLQSCPDRRPIGAGAMQSRRCLFAHQLHIEVTQSRRAMGGGTSADGLFYHAVVQSRSHEPHVRTVAHCPKLHMHGSMSEICLAEISISSSMRECSSVERHTAPRMLMYCDAHGAWAVLVTVLKLLTITSSCREAAQPSGPAPESRRLRMRSNSSCGTGSSTGFWQRRDNSNNCRARSTGRVRLCPASAARPGGSP